jgi:hypothetical protein
MCISRHPIRPLGIIGQTAPKPNFMKFFLADTPFFFIAKLFPAQNFRKEKAAYLLPKLTGFFQIINCIKIV